MKWCKRLLTVGKLTVRERCKYLQAPFKQQSNYHANNTWHTRLWAGNKRPVGRGSKKPRPEKPARKHRWRQVDSSAAHIADAPGCQSLRNRHKTVLTWLLQVIPATMMMMKRLLNQDYSEKNALLKAPNPPIREFIFFRRWQMESNVNSSSWNQNRASSP